MNTADGSVIGACMNKHRHQEWLRFLNLIIRSTPADKEIHIICDNYATHNHQKVKAWQKRHPRFQFHFTQAIEEHITHHNADPKQFVWTAAASDSERWVNASRSALPSAPRCSVRGAARFVRHTTVHSNHEQRSKSARTPLLDTGKTGNESAVDGLADYP